MAIETIKEAQTLSEFAKRFDVHSQMISNWKREFLEYPTKGVLGMVDYLRILVIVAGPKCVWRLLRLMGIMALCPRRNLSKLGAAKYVETHRLRGLMVTHSKQVWFIDLTYNPMKH